MLDNMPDRVNGATISRGDYLNALDHITPMPYPRCSPAAQKMVLWCLDTFLRGKGSCWPRQSVIAERCCMGREAVNRALSALADQSLVHIRKHRQPNGTEWCVYSVNERAIMKATQTGGGVTTGHRGCDHRPQGGVTTGHTLKPSCMKPSNESLIQQDDDAVEFGAQEPARHKAVVVGEIPYTPPKEVGEICKALAKVCNRPVSGISAEFAHRLIRQANAYPVQIDGGAVSALRLVSEAIRVTEDAMSATSDSGGSQRVTPSRVVQYAMGVLRNAHLDQALPAIRDVVVQSPLERSLDAQHRAHVQKTKRALAMAIERGLV